MDNGHSAPPAASPTAGFAVSPAGNKQSHLPADAKHELVKRVTHGRPPKFATPEELEFKINEYFDAMDNHEIVRMDAEGKVVKIPKPRPYTMSGLALHLGFASTSSLRHYESKEEFCYLLVAARTRVEQQRNEQLVQGQGQCGGLIFDLKNNHNWKDTHTQEVVGPDGGPVQHAVVVGLAGMPPTPKNMDEWEQWYKSMEAKKRAEIEAANAIDIEPIP